MGCRAPACDWVVRVPPEQCHNKKGCTVIFTGAMVKAASIQKDRRRGASAKTSTGGRPLAVLEVSWFGEDARAVSPGALMVGVDVVHSNHHGVGGLAGPGRPAVATDVPDDHCSVADVHLGAVVLANA